MEEKEGKGRKLPTDQCRESALPSLPENGQSRSVHDFRVALVSMPHLDGRNPLLASACLRAFLRQKGIPVSVHGFHRLPTAHTIEAFLRSIRQSESLYAETVAKWEEIGSASVMDDAAFLRIFVKRCFRRLRDVSPDLVGFSVQSMNLLPSLLLAGEIRKQDPGVKIVFGGPHCAPLDNAEFFAGSGCVDAVVRGEGEGPLYDLLLHFVSERRSAKNSSGEASSPVIVDRPEPGRCIPMDELPFPDFADSCEPEDSDGPALPVFFSRGCVGGCKFCEERHFWGHYRQMSVSRTVDMIEHMIATYGIRNFWWAQSLVDADMGWLADFSDLVARRGLNMSWAGNAKVRPELDPSFLRKLAESGCKALSLGAESGSPKVLRKMGKGTSVEQLKEAVRNVSESGIWVHCYWIVGFPTESREDLLETLNLAVAIHPYVDSCFFHGYHPPVANLIRKTSASHPSRRNDLSGGEPQPMVPSLFHGHGSASNYFREHGRLFTRLMLRVSLQRPMVPFQEPGGEEQLRERREAQFRFMTALALFRRAVEDDAVTSRMDEWALAEQPFSALFGDRLEDVDLDNLSFRKAEEIVDEVIKGLP